MAKDWVIAETAIQPTNKTCKGAISQPLANRLFVGMTAFIGAASAMGF